MRSTSVEVGARFAYIESDANGEWLVEGHVCAVTPFCVDVDFGDWKQRYPRGSVVPTTFMHMDFLSAGGVQGTIIADYRLLGVGAIEAV